MHNMHTTVLTPKRMRVAQSEESYRHIADAIRLLYQPLKCQSQMSYILSSATPPRQTVQTDPLREVLTALCEIERQQTRGS